MPLHLNMLAVTYYYVTKMLYPDNNITASYPNTWRDAVVMCHTVKFKKEEQQEEVLINKFVFNGAVVLRSNPL